MLKGCQYYIVRGKSKILELCCVFFHSDFFIQISGWVSLLYIQKNTLSVPPKNVFLRKKEINEDI